jgi:hypothetical protein
MLIAVSSSAPARSISSIKEVGRKDVTLRLLHPDGISSGEKVIAALFNRLKVTPSDRERDGADAIVPEHCPQSTSRRDALVPRCDERGLRHLHTLIGLLHAQQHPPKTTCASQRLLVLQAPVPPSEGIGSILLTVAMGLAEAAYSNRTLVWGADLSDSLEQGRLEWQAAQQSASCATSLGHDGCLLIRGVPVSCEMGGGGGAYGCIFKPLSSCSLADVQWNELRELGNGDAHNEYGARVALLRRRWVS